MTVNILVGLHVFSVLAWRWSLHQLLGPSVQRYVVNLAFGLRRVLVLTDYSYLRSVLQKNTTFSVLIPK